MIFEEFDFLKRVLFPEKAKITMNGKIPHQNLDESAAELMTIRKRFQGWAKEISHLRRTSSFTNG